MKFYLRSVTIVLFLSLWGCEDPPPPEAAAALISRVELAAGDVFGEENGEKSRLITGAMLAESTEISVEAGGRALVRLDNGAGVFFRGGARAVISEGTVTLKAGEIWADVPPGETEMGRFSAGDATVSATDAGLDIAYDGKTVRVYVARGLAVVAGPGGRREVKSGEQVVVAGDAPLAVTPVAFWEDWTGGMADRPSSVGSGGQGSGRILGIDRSRPGAPPSVLEITAQSVRVGIKDGIAHTVVDQRFFNPSGTPLEGWYWFTIPEGASVERFALEVNGSLVEGEMVERKQAAAAYEEAVQKAFDPALLEWVDGRTFRARIFPIPAAGERRVVLSYFELLPLSGGAYRYTYPMASSGDTSIQEFSLTVNLGADGEKYDIRTLQDATVEQDKTRVSMRRSGFRPQSDFLLELAPKEAKAPAPLRVVRYAAGSEEADYVMMRYAPDVEWDALTKVQGDVVVVLDTSAGGDDADRQVRTDTVEAILRALSKGDRFAVMTTDLTPVVIFPEKGLAEATEENVSTAVSRLSEIPSAGATDMGEMFSGALDLLYDAAQPAVVYVGDGLATVGETSSSALAGRLRRALGGSRARLFTIAVGADADVALLGRLARIGGGRSFTISRSEQAVQEALRFVGMLKTPTVTDLEIDAGKGLDQVYSTQSGKLSKGDEMILLARTHHALPDEIRIKGRLGSKPFEDVFTPPTAKGSEYGYLPLLWARLYLARLMGDGVAENRGRIISLGLSYSMMTPFSSFLVLESDAAYREQGIERRPRYRFSAFDEAAAGVAVAAREVAFSIPLGLFGCTASDEAPPPAMEMSEMSKQEARAPRDMNEGAATTALKGGNAPPPAPPMASEEIAVDAKPSPSMAKSTGDTPGRPEKKRARRSSSEVDDLLAGHLGGLATAGGRSGSGYGRGGGGIKEKAKSRPRPDSVRPVSVAVGDPYQQTEQRPAIFAKGVCSDASRRPLRERRILWARRLSRVSEPPQLKGVFFDAGKQCELDRWRDRKVLLDLIERHAATPLEVTGLLAAFEGYGRIQSYLRKKILRRVLDPEMAMGLYYPGMPDWAAVERGLAAIADPAQRLASLKEILAKHPNDPNGKVILIALLAEMGKSALAMREAERLKRDGLAGPRVLEVLCDLQAAADDIQAAKRTCSELVEFNPADPAARRRLGDIFLRHGWYDEAYRQYASLTVMNEDDPIALLRLAAAAAGMGKIDEALRLERKVASGDGEPGPADPRRFARLHSAVRLAEMLKAAREVKDDAKAKAIERSLKQTQVFGTASTLVLLVWEDLQAPLTLMPKIGDERYAVSEMVVSEETGLMMVDLGAAPPDALELQVESKSDRLKRKVPFTLLTIQWDGKRFVIETRPGTEDPTLAA